MKAGIGVLALGLSLSLPSSMTMAGIIGVLGNFDAINDTGKTAHGFEIDLEGLHSSDVSDVFGGPGRGFPTGTGFDPLTSVERYGSPSIIEYSLGSIFGVKITYKGTFNGTSWDYGTPTTGTNNIFATPGDNCWSGGGLPGMGYAPDTPCDHFGVGTLVNPTKTTYNWLVETATPGVLSNGVANIPAPVFTNPVRPPAADPAGPAVPLVVAQIRAPDPGPIFDFGDALWVKVFTTELGDPVELEDLVGGAPPVDLALGNTEKEWQLLQVEKGNPNSGILESEGQEGGGESVVRRYEFYKFTGEYKADHEALFVFGDTLPNICDPLNPAYEPDPNVNGCDSSAPDEVGSYLGAQNAAALLGAAPVATPEPGTSALLLLGGGLLGFASRRRRRALISSGV